MSDDLESLVPRCDERGLPSLITDTYGCCQIVTRCSECTRPRGCVVSYNKLSTKLLGSFVDNFGVDPLTFVGKSRSISHVISEESGRRYGEQVVNKTLYRLTSLARQARKGHDPTGS